jgi:release factor glutamine methyltransferase
MTDNSSAEQSRETVERVLRRGVQELIRTNVESPHLTAELLLGHAMGWNRVRVLSDAKSPLSELRIKHFQTLLQRRASGEPLQYITREREFYGISFRVTPAVLIPRPETEILVEEAIRIARKRKSQRELCFADIGTGSGCIAVSVARELPWARVWAMDISPGALQIAQLNAGRHKVRDRVQFICGSFLECFPARPCFNFVLCNPPYVSQADMATLSSMVSEHEPHQALCSGETGLESFRQVVPAAAARLLSSGYLIMEVGKGQSGEVARLIEREGLSLERILDDLQGIPRCVVATKPN